MLPLYVWFYASCFFAVAVVGFALLLSETWGSQGARMPRRQAVTDDCLWGSGSLQNKKPAASDR